MRTTTLALLLLLAGGCDLPDKGDKDRCFTQRDCVAGYVCEARHCVLPDADMSMPGGGGGSGGDGGAAGSDGGGMECAGTVVEGACLPGRWTRGADMPTARERLALVALPDGRIVALGGISGAGGPQKKVEIYTPSTDSWTTVAPMNQARYGFGAVLGPDGKLYAIGGPYDFPTSSQPKGADGDSRTVEFYDFGTGRWDLYTVPWLRKSRYEARAFVGSDKRIYAVGGFDYSVPEQSASMEVWTPGTDQWGIVNFDMNVGRSSFAVTLGADGRAFVLGGTAANDNRTTAVESFLPVDHGWTTVPPLSGERNWLAAATDGQGRIWSLGGNGASGVSWDVVEVYTPSTKKWTPGTPMPTPRFAHAAVTGADGRIYVIGGNAGGDPQQVGTLEILTP
jgi:hypothetical protein